MPVWRSLENVKRAGRCQLWAQAAALLWSPPPLLGWYLLHVLATVVGGTAILQAMDVQSWMRNFCGWQIQSQVTSCSRGCLANCLSFHHTSRIASFSSSDWSGDACIIFFIMWLKSRKIYHHLYCLYKICTSVHGAWCWPVIVPREHTQARN